MTLLEKLRLGFLGRSRREKLLTVLFLVVVAGVWLTLLSNRVRAFGPTLTAIRAEAERQSDVLADEERITSLYETAFASLSQDRPPGKVAYETVDQIVRAAGAEAGFRFAIDPTQPQQRDQLTYYPINVTIYKADFFKLRDLFNTITGRLPTVNLAEVVLSVPDRTNANFLDARFKFVAIEINR